MTSPQTQQCRHAPTPSTHDLTWEQLAGRTCCICGKTLPADRVYRGVIEQWDGALLLDFDVWACPDPEATR